MTALVALLGAVIALLGIVAALRPQAFRALIPVAIQGRRLYGAIAFRFAFGALLIAAAPACRASTAVLVFGVFTLAAGVLGAFLGLERLRAFAGWWLARPPVVVRLWGLVALGIGGFLVYAGA